MKSHLFIFISTILLSFSGAIAQHVDTCPFVYWENNHFMYQGDTFVLKAVSYDISFHVVDSSNNTILFGPNRNCIYLWDSTYHYPTNQDSINDIMHAHFKTIKDMGFNTVRILDWVIYQDFAEPCLYIPLWDRFQYHLSGQRYSPTSCVGDCDTWNDYIKFSEFDSIYFAATDKIFEIANEYGLKVLWNCGAGKLENCTVEYSNFLDTISKRYANDPALFAYDLWAEPHDFSIDSIKDNSLLKRQTVFSITDQMNVAIKSNDKNHFTTIGTVDLRHELDFGFKSLCADFLNVHIYDIFEFYFNLPDYATENILKRDIFWLKNNVTDKNWLIGEVGLPGGDSLQLDNPPLFYDGIYADWEEQNRVAAEILNYSVACSGNGLVWWRFHDVNWVSTSKDERVIKNYHDCLGCISQKESTLVTGLKGSCSVSSMYIFGKIKDIGLPAGTFNSFTTSTTTCILDSVDYFNPNHKDDSSVYTGYVYNINGGDTIPVSEAIVQITKRIPKFFTDTIRTVLYYGITDSNGRFDVHTTHDSVPAQMIKVGYYGMTDDMLWGPTLDDDSIQHQNHNFYLYTVPYGTPTTFPSDIAISSNTTWDTGEDRWLAGNITVDSGATLTIKCNVYFTAGKGITVMQGGKLSLQGGTLSSAGNNYLWNGITLMGNTSLNQSDANQGSFSMNYGAVIANANIAVKVYGGGICRIYDGSFINNKCSVYFYAYTNPSVPTFNESSISGADFYITGPLNNAQTPSYFAYLSSVKDIEFFSCTFTNSSDNSIRANYRSKGIHATNSTPEVSSTTFNGLYYGVYCSGGTPKVYNSTFENNFRGIYTGNSTNVDINNNSFDGSYTFLGAKGELIFNPPPYIYEPYSVYIAGDGVNNTVYKFEDNTFENGKIGSLFYNTGPNAVQAKRNSYSNITGATNACAAVTIGKNSDFVYNSGTQFGEQGLEFRCNTFNTNAYSLSIIDGNMRKYQGEQGASQGSDYAGNAFDHVGTNIHRDFYVDTVVVSSLNIPLYEYYSHSDNPHKILYFTNSKINHLGQAFNFQETDCSEVGGGGGIEFGMSIGEGTEIIEQTDTEIMLKEFELEETVDDGNTYLLLSETETMNNENSVAVASDIAALDGYISDEVVLTYLQNNNGNQFAKANALLENSPLPASVRDEIDNMQMNPTLKQIVKNQQNGINNRDKKQVEIAELKQYRGMVVNEMVNSAFYNDSVPSEKQALKQFLQNDNNLQSKFHLLNLYKNNNDYNNANATLNEIKQSLQNMDNDFVSEFDDYIEIQKIMLDIESNTINVEDAVENNADFLTMIASSESHPGQVAAQLLLAEAGVEDYYEFILLPELPFVNKSLSVSENKVPSQNIDYGDIINVYPNPSNGTIYVEYAFINFSSKNDIEIYSINGNLIDRVLPQQAAGLYTYNKALAPGNYIIKVGDSFSQQITVQ